MFPPGFAKLATKPVATGSPLGAITIGIVPVAALAACTSLSPPVMMTLTLSVTSSAARAGNWSGFPSADRKSKTRLRPSTYPRSRIAVTNVPNLGGVIG
jgi:hypothetical protein